jgi:hypothetical protein
VDVGVLEQLQRRHGTTDYCVDVDERTQSLLRLHVTSTVGLLHVLRLLAALLDELKTAGQLLKPGCMDSMLVLQRAEVVGVDVSAPATRMRDGCSAVRSSRLNTRPLRDGSDKAGRFFFEGV